MKRKVIIFLLLVVIAITNCAFGETKEITFHKIPWLALKNDCFRILQNGGYLSSEHTSFPSSETGCIFLLKDDNGLILPYSNKMYDEISETVSIGDYYLKKIAGYNVKDIMLSFAKTDKGKQLISVQVELKNADYNDIKRKLETVYGQGEETIDDIIVKSTIWKGNDSSALLLFTEDGGETFYLVYCRSDAEQILKEALGLSTIISDPDDVSGL